MMNSHIAALEPRRLLAAAFPTPVEQYEVELINRARANPTAEATRLGITLNEGLSPGTISTAAKQPLAINLFITDAARKHSAWMLDNDKFQHAGLNNSSPQDRMTTAGYIFVAPFTNAENIAYRSQKPAVPDPFATSALIHSDLFVDKGIDGRGHRTNIMNGALREIGAGIVSGDFQSSNAVMLTTDFAATADRGPLLTGVLYNDSVARDAFYTPGEGLGRVTITATRIGDGAVFTTDSFASGGYTLPLATGFYKISASGSGFTSPLTAGNVVMVSENVKQDFRPGDGGIIRGTVFNDTNGDGVQQAGETGVGGLLVFLDTKRDGRRNRGELYARTHEDGTYRFNNLAPGTYRVRETLPQGSTLASPAIGYYTARLLAGRTLGGRNFANIANTGRPATRAYAPPAANSTTLSIDRSGNPRLIDGLL